MARPFRYTFILVLVALGTCLAAASGWRFARASAPVNGPIILISIDSLRADHLPAYGYQAVRTPALDALAADSVVFEHAYSPVPQTLPAHAALLTGRLPFENGVRDGVGFTLKNSERLLPEMLHDRGFATAGVVSTYLLRKETGLGQGFSFFDGIIPAASGDDTATDRLHRDGAESEQIAERWLDGAGTSRAFLFLHLDEPRAGRGDPSNIADLSTYDRGIAAADQIVGRLVRYLRAHQLYDQSTVIVVSDHGQGLGDHGEQGHGLLVYDEALHVPLLIKQPAGERAGRRVRQPVQLVDLVPTILDLAKAPNPGSLSGRSLKPLLDNPDQTARRAIYSESLFGTYHFGWTGLRTITDGRFRYIAGDHEELYDLTRDPGQRESLVDAQPEILASLRNDMKKVAPGVAEAAPGTPPADERARYDALGYVGVGPDSNARNADPQRPVEIVERYRAAVDAAAARNWTLAIDAFRALLREQPPTVNLWLHLANTAARAERQNIALDAYKHAVEIDAEDSEAQLGAATALLKLRKLDEARQHAASVAEGDGPDTAPRAAAHEILARIALAHHDADLARAEAAEAEAADSHRPIRAYVEGRLAYDQGQYGDAVASFEDALAVLEKVKGRALPDLRVYAAEALVRLDRHGEAEYLLMQELTDFPASARARASLAALYRSTGRPDEAAVTLSAH